MHLHNVASYAPPGYRLERSDMGSGGCTHRFVAEGLPELVCEGSWPDAEAERTALEAFKNREWRRLEPKLWGRLDAMERDFDATPNVVAEVAGGFVVAAEPPPKPKAAPKKR